MWLALCVLSVLLCSRCQPSFPFKEASQQRPSPQSPLLSVSQRFRVTTYKKQCTHVSRKKWFSVKSKFISQLPSHDINFHMWSLSWPPHDVQNACFLGLRKHLFWVGNQRTTLLKRTLCSVINQYGWPSQQVVEIVHYGGVRLGDHCAAKVQEQPL